MASIKAEERKKGTVYVARVRTPGGGTLVRTFRTKTDAKNWAAVEEGKKKAGRQPGHVTAGKTTFGKYAADWMEIRKLRPKTVESYRDLLKRFILPEFEKAPLSRITPHSVSTWYAKLLRADKAAGRSHNQTAKSYRLLHTIMNTAVADDILAANPCRIVGAGQERPDERPSLEIGEVQALAEAIDDRYRALVLTAAFAGLRRGELLALRRRHVNFLQGTLTVQNQADRKGNESEPKTPAGKRTRPLPAFLADALAVHMDQYTENVPHAHVFTGPRGTTEALNVSTLKRAWTAATEATGLEHVTLHDLRHFSGTYFAQMGATTAEIMGHLGHASAAAAMRYQHEALSRTDELAKRMNEAYVATPPNASVTKISDKTATKRRSRGSA